MSSKVSALTQATPLVTDLLYLVDDPGGTPVSKSVLISALDTLLSSTTKTLTNKTLTLPQINDTSADHQYVFAVSELAADRTVTLPLLTANDEFVFANHTVTLTNKNIGDPTDNTKDIAFTLSGATTAKTLTLISAHTDDRSITFPDATGTLATLDGTETFTNKTLDDPKIEYTLNTQTGTTYTLALTDSTKIVEMNNASANTVTIPTNASVAFAVGTTITIVQYGAGATTVSGDTGVTVNGTSAGSTTATSQYEGVALYKRATDEWIAVNYTTS